MALGFRHKLRVRPQPIHVLARCHPGISQVVRIDAAVIQHVRKHRQMRPWASEAGGQLFGSISADEVAVTVVSGPYRGDDRGRYHYRSNPQAAQAAIDRNARTGHLYLGEWHTHAEGVPQASTSDIDAMARLLAKSSLNSDAILLLIVGQSEMIDGLRLRTVGRLGSHDWSLCPV